MGDISIAKALWYLSIVFALMPIFNFHPFSLSDIQLLAAAIATNSLGHTF